jgi:uncharacterized protein YycO
MVQSSLFANFFFNIPIDQHIRSLDHTKTYHMLRGRHGHDGMVAGLQKYVQSVPITTEVVSSNRGKVSSIQHYGMKFVSHLQ